MIRYIIILAALLASGNGKAQSKELGFFFGSSYYIGDLNPNQHFVEDTKPAGGLIYRQSLNKRYSLKFNGYLGNVQANDSKSTSEFQKKRNLHFRSQILEIGANIEFNYFKFEFGRGERPASSSYLFTGLSYFKMKPEAFHNGVWYDLQNFGTEGQGTSVNNVKKYRLDQVAIPIGIGFKVNLSEKVTFSAEWGIRKTYTDYLDDVSTVYADQSVLLQENGPLASEFGDRSPALNRVGSMRGNPNTNDWYVFSGIILALRLDNDDKQCRSYQ